MLRPLAPLALASLLVPAADAQVAYATRYDSQVLPETLVRLDLAVGAITDVGALPQDTFFSGLTFDLQGVLFGYARELSGSALGLYRIDPTTGTTTFVGAGGLAGGDSVRGLAVEPVTGRLLGVGNVLDGAVRLYELDPATGTAALDASFGAPTSEHVGIVDFWIDRTGRRYVIGFGSLFHGNPEFAQVYELKGSALEPLPQGLGYEPNPGGHGVALDPATDRVWFVSSVGWSQDSLFEIDPATGAAVQDIGSLPGTLTTLAFDGFDAASQGSAYCDAAANSTGAIGQLAGAGSADVAVDLFELRADGLPANQFGFFLVAPERDFLPMAGGSQGNLCLKPSAGIGRYDAQSTGAAGAFARRVPLDMLPLHGAVQPGETWYFQAWYRDQNPGATSNFTRGLRVDFE